jgi:threonine dehydratase
VSPAEIAAAAERLRGHLVATPWIGALALPGAAHLRLKPELLQPGGSIWYRGWLHWLLRQLGAVKGLVIEPVAGARAAFAALLAADATRVECVVAAAGAPELVALLHASGHERRLGEAAAPDLARRFGFRRLPPAEDRDVQAGLATAGLEIAREMPAGVEAIFVAPAAVAPAIESGLRAGGCGLPVRIAAASVGLPTPTARLLLRLDAGPESLGALQAAIDAREESLVLLGE